MREAPVVCYRRMIQEEQFGKNDLGRSIWEEQFCKTDLGKMIWEERFGKNVLEGQQREAQQ
jgi:hypothetical protein